jgi:hypothetical protein
MRDRHRRGLIQPYVSPTDKLYTSFGASGMARRMGTESKKSWALSHVHIAYVDQVLQQRYNEATSIDEKTRPSMRRDHQPPSLPGMALEW